jgi:probable HAF family extracellular repeat protein
MKTKRNMNTGPLRSSAVGLASLMAAALALPGTAATSYTITDLGTPPNLAGSYVNSYNGGPMINNLRHVAGFANDYGNPNAFTGDSSFLWTGPGEIEFLPGLPGTTDTMAFAINDRDQVVGYSGFGYATGSAVLWEDGVVSELEGPGGAYIGYTAVSINNAGTVIGFGTTPNFGLISAFVWHDQKIRLLPPLESGDILTQASAVNDKGQIVGAAGPNWWANYFAVLWDHEKIINLGTLGGLASFANAINNSGQIVGLAQIAGASGDWHAAAWQRGAITDLGNLGSDPFGQATCINNRGQIVGYSSQSDLSTPHPLLWREGSMTELQTLIPTDSGWVLQMANGINDRGQIAGWGLHNGAYRAFVLTPWEVEKP